MSTCDELVCPQGHPCRVLHVVTLAAEDGDGRHGDSPRLALLLEREAHSSLSERVVVEICTEMLPLVRHLVLGQCGCGTDPGNKQVLPNNPPFVGAQQQANAPDAHFGEPLNERGGPDVVEAGRRGGPHLEYAEAVVAINVCAGREHVCAKWSVRVVAADWDK